jgi:hypothetical protein
MKKWDDFVDEIATLVLEEAPMSLSEVSIAGSVIG